jgi:hypothetical protein
MGDRRRREIVDVVPEPGRKIIIGLARGGRSDYYWSFVRGARAATPVNPGKGVYR